MSLHDRSFSRPREDIGRVSPCQTLRNGPKSLLVTPPVCLDCNAGPFRFCLQFYLFDKVVGVNCHVKKQSDPGHNLLPSLWPLFVLSGYQAISRILSG